MLHLTLTEILAVVKTWHVFLSAPEYLAFVNNSRSGLLRQLIVGNLLLVSSHCQVALSLSLGVNILPARGGINGGHTTALQSAGGTRAPEGHKATTQGKTS